MPHGASKDSKLWRMRQRWAAGTLGASKRHNTGHSGTLTQCPFCGEQPLQERAAQYQAPSLHKTSFGDVLHSAHCLQAQSTQSSFRHDCERMETLQRKAARLSVADSLLLFLRAEKELKTQKDV